MQQPEFNAPIVGAVNQKVELTADTLVGVRFRGGPPVVDMYDSIQYVVPPVPEGERLETWRRTMQPPADFRLKFAVAQHLRDRAIVPGTWNPAAGVKAASRLAIIWTPTGKSVDREDRQQPFTDEQLALFGYHEAIDRRHLPPSGQQVRVIPVSAVLTSMPQLEHDPEASAPPAVHEGLREVQRGEGEAAEAGVRASRTRASQTRFKDGS